jgi:hypothetical protein
LGEGEKNANKKKRGEALEQTRRVPLSEIYRTFFVIGLFSFGGGLVSWIYRDAVDVRKWMSREDFLPGVALAQVMPGVSSTNCAIYVGQILRGWMGALTAITAVQRFVKVWRQASVAPITAAKIELRRSRRQHRRVVRTERINARITRVQRRPHDD